MRRIVLAVAALILLTSSVSLISSDIHGEAQTVYNEQMSDIYVLEFEAVGNNFNAYVGYESNAVASCVIFKSGSARENAFLASLANKTNPDMLNDYGFNAGDKLRVYVSVCFGKENLVINYYNDGSEYGQRMLNGEPAYKSNVTKHTLYSGQTVKIEVNQTDYNLNFGFSPNWNDRMWIDSENSKEYDITSSGEYRMFSHNTVFVSYSIEYDPLVNIDIAIFGYISLAIGILCIVPFFLFSRKQRLDK